MINLVPPDAKKQVRMEYVVRVASVWVMLCAVALCAGAAALVPTAMLIHNQLQSSPHPEGFDEAAQQKYTAMLEDLRKARTYAQLIQVPHAVLRPTDIVSHVENAMTSDVRSESLTFALDGTGSSTVVMMRGEAKTRTALTSFIARLKKDPYFIDANVPVSDLAPDVDLPFSVTMVVAKPK